MASAFIELSLYTEGDFSKQCLSVAETRTHARRLHYGQETGINVRPPVYGDVTWTEISLLMISFFFPLYINDLYPYTKVTNNPDISIVLGNKNVE